MDYHHEIDIGLKRISPIGRGKITAAAEHGQLEVEVLQSDNLGIAFGTFSFHSDLLASADTSRLTRIADNVASRLTYLLEPLRVVEVDGDAGAVQMRSHPPYHRSEQTRYYEVLVQRGGSLSLVRYERTPGQPRTAIAAAVTLEVFYRLADDFAASVG